MGDFWRFGYRCSPFHCRTFCTCIFDSCQLEFLHFSLSWASSFVCLYDLPSFMLIFFLFISPLLLAIIHRQTMCSTYDFFHLVSIFMLLFSLSYSVQYIVSVHCILCTLLRNHISEIPRILFLFFLIV